MGQGALPPFEEIPHTADLALRVRGADWPALLIHAAQGLFFLLRCEPRGPAAPASRQITLEADDPETLLVDWLNELIYLSETHHELYTAFAFTHLTWTQLQATVQGWDHHPPQKYIKAATFFDLKLLSTAAGYEVTITFDV